MSQNRWSAKNDSNQAEIVKDLRKLGISVMLFKHDIIIGFRGKNYLIEIKNPEYAQSKKTGKVKESSKRDSQKKLDIEWQGQRGYCFTLDDVLRVIGFKIND